MSSTASDKLRVAGVVNDSITDGPGLRLTVFLQGCLRDCPGCHNPKAQPLDGGALYEPEALMRMIRQNPLLTGVTLSGGEPLLQARALAPFAKMIKNAGLSIAVYTGYTFEEILGAQDDDAMSLLALCDTLIDGPFLENEKSLTLPFRGSKNQRILDIRKSLRQKSPVEESGEGWRAK